MSYIAYARRFRPARFDQLAGQEAVVATLRHALEQDRVSHAYLFAGPRGTGKTTSARILARALNCHNGPAPEPCGECPSCRELASGGSMDVIEIDAASHNGVDDIRELRDAAHGSTHGSRYRVYVLDEVHMLSTAAFNALLKILEEPPAHVKFILCTTDPQKVPETVRSRCQRLDFRRITIPQVVARLGQIASGEGLRIGETALREIALYAQGGLRDAEVLLEQLSIFSEDEITPEDVRSLTGAVDAGKLAGLLDSLAQGDAGEALASADTLLEAGADPVELAEALMAHLRAAIAVQLAGADSALVASRGMDVEAASLTAGALSQEEMLYAAAVLQSTRREARTSEHPRILLELALVRLSRIKDLVSLEELAAFARGSGGSGSAGASGGGRPSAEDIRRRLQERRAKTAQAAPKTEIKPAAPRPESIEPKAAPRPEPIEPKAEAAPEPIEPKVEASPKAEQPAASAGPEPESPVEVPEPQQAVAADGPPLLLEEVARRWSGVVEEAVRRSPTVGAFLKPARPVSVTGREITLGFIPKFTFHMNGLMAEASRMPLALEAAASVFGGPVRLRLQSVAGEVEDEPPAPAVDRRAVEAEAYKDPGVRKIIERFDGRVLRIDPGEARP